MMELNIIYLLSLALHTVLGNYPVSPTGPGGSKFDDFATFGGLSLAAFSDLNNDRRTDIITIGKNNSIIVLFEPDVTKLSPFIFSNLKSQPPVESIVLKSGVIKDPIRSIVANDFDGDSVTDLLIFSGKSLDPPYKMHISYGKKTPTYTLEAPTELMTIVAQPLICDFNADHIADIYAEDESGKRYVIFGSSTMKPVQDTKYNGPRWLNLGYSAFADLNGDYVADSLIMVKSDNVVKLQFLSGSIFPGNNLPDFNKAKLIDLPSDIVKAGANAVLGQFRISDFNKDGKIDLILPACLTKDCDGSSVLYILDFDEKSAWRKVDVDIAPKGYSTEKWSFTPVTASLSLSSSQLAGFSTGDINLDGYVDIAVTLTRRQQGVANQFVPALMLGSVDNNGKLYFSTSLFLKDNYEGFELNQIAFFDQDENGILDVWVNLQKDKTQTVKLYKQTESTNNYFLMVMTLNGRCEAPSTCPMPYGLTTPGSLSIYKTDTSSNQWEKAVGVQMPLSTCTALELPYLLFGLGELANYVRIVEVVTPTTGSKLFSRRDVEFVVPDSQLVINPYKPNEPANWMITLYLQPLYNMKVIIILITLISLILILAIIASVLHCLEVRQDREEKMKESQGFYFDAM